MRLNVPLVVLGLSLCPIAHAGKASYEYDAIGRLIAHTTAAGQRTTYSYDARGNLLKVTTTTPAAQQPLNPRSWAAASGPESNNFPAASGPESNNLTAASGADQSPVGNNSGARP